MLELLIDQLNDISKCRYSLGGAYGGVNLQKKSMECTGISMLSDGNTKKELYYQLQMLLDWHSYEKRSKADYVKNCTHHDIFNLHSFKEGEKRQSSHINKYEEKGSKYYQCITCNKKVSKAVYEASRIPKSHDELKNMRVRE